MGNYRLDACVEGELWEIWRFIAQDNPDAATSIVEAAFQTFARIAANPEIGAKRIFRSAKLRGIRSLRISGYPNYLIFYRVTPDGIQVHHIYHGARDFESLLKKE